jgi:hypothetical protein
VKLLPPPGPQRKRQLIVLGGLVLVLAIYFGRGYWPTTSAPAQASNKGTASSGKDKDKDKIVLPPPVNWSILLPPPLDSNTARNPFQFGQPPRPPAPPPTTATPYVPPPPQPPPQPMTPQVPLRCTGMSVVSETKQRIALMFDPETGSSQWMLEGSVFDGRYKIVKVNAESVVVSFVDGTGQKTVFVER